MPPTLSEQFQCLSLISSCNNINHRFIGRERKSNYKTKNRKKCFYNDQKCFITIKSVIKTRFCVFFCDYSFRITLRFPSNKSVADIITRRYGRETLTLFRQCKNVESKLRKSTLDYEYAGYERM